MDLNDIADISAVVRDVAFVVVCIVVAIAGLVIMSGVQKAVRRINQTMDRVDDLIDTIVAARDSLAELKKRIQSRSSIGGTNSDGGFNVFTWMMTPLGFVIGQLFKRRSRNDDTRNG